MSASAPLAGSPPERIPVWRGVWLLAAANCALLVANLGRDSLWLDEMTSVMVARFSPSQAVHFFTLFPEQHPLYYILLKVWVLLGTSEVALRSFSVLATVLATIVMYFVGRRILGEREARIATAIAAFSPFLIYYGQEGRMYAQLLLLTLLMTYCFLRWIEEPSARWSVLYWVVAIAAIYTHLFAAFVVAAHFAWTALSPTKRHRLVGATTLAGAVAVAYLPWVVFMLRHPSSPQAWKSWVHVVFGIPYTLLRWTVGYSIVLANAGWQENIRALVSADAAILAIAAVGFGWAALAGLRRTLPEWKEPPGLILSLLIVPAVIAVAMSPIAILVSDRYLIVSFPAYAFLLAAGLTRLQSLRARGMAAVAPALIGITLVVALWRYYGDPRFGKATWREAAEMVVASRTASDPIVVHDGSIKDVFLRYAADTTLPVFRGPTALDSVRGAPRVWLVVAHADDGGKGILTSLRGSYDVARDTLFPRDVGIRVILLNKKP